MNNGINYTPETLYRIMRERMADMEKTMADLEERLDRMRGEHRELYGMALAYDDPEIAPVKVAPRAEAPQATPF